MPVKKQTVQAEKFTLECIEHANLTENIGALTKKKTALTAKLKEDLFTLGTADDKGHVVFSKEHADLVVTAINTLRVSTSLVPEAIEILKKSGLTEYITEETVEILDQEALEADIRDGKINARLASRLFTTAENFAFSAKIKPKPKAV